MNENDVKPGRERLPRIPAEERKVRAPRMPRVALVRDADLVEAEPHDQAAEIGIGFAQSQQMVDGGARQQLEVAGIDGQLDRRAELNQPIGQPRRRHLQRVLAVAPRAHGVDDVGALPPALDQARESLPADPAGRRPCRRRRRRATSPCRRCTPSATPNRRDMFTILMRGLRWRSSTQERRATRRSRHR